MTGLRKLTIKATGTVFLVAWLLVACSCACGEETVRVRSRSLANRAVSAESETSASMIDFRTPPITSVTARIEPRAGPRPANIASAKLTDLASRSEESVLVRDWSGLCYCWDASAFSHQPLYFEEVNLERYGYGPRYLRAVQPVLSGAHFFASVPLLPYKMGAEPPGAEVYALGHYRPGSPAPYRIVRPPFSLRGGATETATVLGLFVLIP